jgi:predicted O-linked N-acetylglucosamine transferase (SPINDLY family)
MPPVRRVAQPRDDAVTAGPPQAAQRAIAAYQRGAWAEAEELCREVLGANGDQIDALHLLGTIAAQTSRPAEANELLARAAGANPRDPEIHNTRGAALRDLARYAEALESYDRAIALMPDYAEAHSNRGVALRNLGRHVEALESYDRAIALRPDFVAACSNRGVALTELKRYRDAEECYRRALHVNPDYAYLYGSWLHAKMQICDWSHLESNFVRLAGKIERDEKAASPFQVLATPCSLAIQRRAAEIVVRDKYPVSRALPEITKAPRHDRIRIGYFSADLHEHATSHLVAELFERHDRSKFQLTAFSFGPASDGAIRKRLAAAFDRFIDVRERTDRDVATLARELGIDIAVDLKGFSQDSRPGIFALRAAPVQVSYLGYPGTMGAEYIDYLVADATLIPDAQQRHYAEKIAYLPNSYQVNDSKRQIADKSFSRDELGLPDQAFVFCCFNNSYKITPRSFDRWMRILGRVRGSVLWLLRDNEWAAASLAREAERRGVGADRLIFAPRMPLAEHLARQRSANLFLDTLPCNAHTTASDALWAGLPVLTCAGETFAGRVGASLLNALRLPELVAETPERYETLAVDLATNPDKLRDIERRLADHRLAQPLFDTALFTRHLESAYEAMFERYRADLPPEHISVPA